MTWQKFVDAVYRMHVAAGQAKADTLHALSRFRRRGHPQLSEERWAEITAWRPTFAKIHEPQANEFVDYLRNTKPPPASKVNWKRVAAALKARRIR